MSVHGMLGDMGPVAKPTPKTIADWLREPEHTRLELVNGEFVEKAAPSFDHGSVQFRIGSQLGPPFGLRPGGRLPGGWWFGSEVDLQLGSNVFRPDLSGWRRERVPSMPKERPLTVRPDWICEIISESNAAHDRVIKLRAYQQAGVPHYWIIDPIEKTLVVMRHTEGGYLNVLAATAKDVVRPEPFEVMEFLVGAFFDDVEAVER